MRNVARTFLTNQLRCRKEHSREQIRLVENGINLVLLFYKHAYARTAYLSLNEAQEEWTN
jgi:hypothetical protein